ncbi:hypothetical protein [Deinococcus arboris]|uniref:hypothetical protein n=1 Tax=Deinococcus arboris TaxID=2682977 RepID=UPI0018DD3CB1|nr:hypothetical protein [Deinococcus arboris]
MRPEWKPKGPTVLQVLAPIVFSLFVIGFVCLGSVPILLGYAVVEAWSGQRAEAGEYLGSALNASFFAILTLAPAMYAFRRFMKNTDPEPRKTDQSKAARGQIGPRK